MASFTTLCMFVLWCSVSQVSGYAIDKSCGSNAGFIQASADDAIGMANAAHDALTANPRDPNVSRLISLLFCKDDQRPDQVDLGPLAETYKAIGQLGPKVASIPFDKNEATKNQVVIFCGVDRVKKRKDGTFVESTTGNIIKNLKQSELDGCHTHELDLAFTWPTERQIWEENGKVQFNFAPSQVTLCPWFVKWASNQPIKFWKASDLKSSLANIAIPLSTEKWPYTPIDSFTLLDKVLLHEFTHTVAGGKKDDIEMRRRDGDPMGKGYGWKAALNLANQGESTDENGDVRSALLNSDSLALFGSGVRLLNLQAPHGPVYINKDGSLTRDRPSPAKRAVPVELQYKSTPAAFEGFLTVIREARAASTMTMEA